MATYLRNRRFTAGIDCVALLPVQIDDMQVNLARGAAREWFIRQTTTLRAEMGTEVVVGRASRR